MQPLNLQTPLHFACKSGDEATVKVLLDHGADINKEDHQGQVSVLVQDRINKISREYI